MVFRIWNSLIYVALHTLRAASRAQNIVRDQAIGMKLQFHLGNAADRKQATLRRSSISRKSASRLAGQVMTDSEWGGSKWSQNGKKSRWSSRLRPPRSQEFCRALRDPRDLHSCGRVRVIGSALSRSSLNLASAQRISCRKQKGATVRWRLKFSGLACV